MFAFDINRKNSFQNEQTAVLFCFYLVVLGLLFLPVDPVDLVFLKDPLDLEGLVVPDLPANRLNLQKQITVQQFVTHPTRKR